MVVYTELCTPSSQRASPHPAKFPTHVRSRLAQREEATELFSQLREGVQRRYHALPFTCPAPLFVLLQVAMQPDEKVGQPPGAAGQEGGLKEVILGSLRTASGQFIPGDYSAPGLR